MQVPLLLAHQADFHFGSARHFFQMFAVVVAADGFSFNSERRNGAPQFVDVVRRNSLGIVSQQERTREVETFSSAASDLVKIMFFLEQCVWRDVLESQAILS